MTKFRNNQRVVVVAASAGASSRRELIGSLGTVERLRMGDHGAWVKMDEDIPHGLRSFPEGDPRQNHVLLYPEECKEWK